MTLALLYPCAAGRELEPEGAGDGEAIDDVLGAALLASDEIALAAQGSSDLTAEPTEAAIAACAARRGVDMDTLLAGISIAHVEPFDSERKRMSVIIDTPDGRFSYAKGAPEVMLARLADPAYDRGLAAVAAGWAERGLRVLLVARRELAEGDEPESNLTPVGLIAFHDPPRPGAAASIEEARTAGVRTVMITGDHPRTALAIAKETHIVGPGDGTYVLTGPGARWAHRGGAEGAVEDRCHLRASRSRAQAPHHQRPARTRRNRDDDRRRRQRRPGARGGARRRGDGCAEFAKALMRRRYSADG